MGKKKIYIFRAGLWPAQCSSFLLCWACHESAYFTMFYLRYVLTSLGRISCKACESINLKNALNFFFQISQGLGGNQHFWVTCFSQVFPFCWSKYTTYSRLLSSILRKGNFPKELCFPLLCSQLCKCWPAIFSCLIYSDKRSITFSSFKTSRF